MAAVVAGVADLLAACAAYYAACADSLLPEDGKDAGPRESQSEAPAVGRGAVELLVHMATSADCCFDACGADAQGGDCGLSDSGAGEHCSLEIGAAVADRRSANAFAGIGNDYPSSAPRAAAAATTTSPTLMSRSSPHRAEDCDQDEVPRARACVPEPQPSPQRPSTSRSTAALEDFATAPPPALPRMLPALELPPPRPRRNPISGPAPFSSEWTMGAPHTADTPAREPPSFARRTPPQVEQRVPSSSPPLHFTLPRTSPGQQRQQQQRQQHQLQLQQPMSSRVEAPPTDAVAEVLAAEKVAAHAWQAREVADKKDEAAAEAAEAAEAAQAAALARVRLARRAKQAQEEDAARAREGQAARLADERRRRVAEARGRQWTRAEAAAAREARLLAAQQALLRQQYQHQQYQHQHQHQHDHHYQQQQQERMGILAPGAEAWTHDGDDATPHGLRPGNDSAGASLRSAVPTKDGGGYHLSADLESRESAFRASVSRAVSSERRQSQQQYRTVPPHESPKVRLQDSDRGLPTESISAMPLVTSVAPSVARTTPARGGTSGAPTRQGRRPANTEYDLFPLPSRSRSEQDTPCDDDFSRADRSWWELEADDENVARHLRGLSEAAASVGTVGTGSVANDGTAAHGLRRDGGGAAGNDGCATLTVWCRDISMVRRGHVNNDDDSCDGSDGSEGDEVAAVAALGLFGGAGFEAYLVVSWDGGSGGGGSGAHAADDNGGAVGGGGDGSGSACIYAQTPPFSVPPRGTAVMLAAEKTGLPLVLHAVPSSARLLHVAL